MEGTVVLVISWPDKNEETDQRTGYGRAVPSGFFLNYLGRAKSMVYWEDITNQALVLLCMVD